MRLAYIVFMPNPIAGIERSVRGKAEAWSGLNAGVDVVVLNPDVEKQDGVVRLVRIDASANRFLRYRQTVMARYDIIERSFDFDAYDLVFLRYPCADSSGLALMRKYPIVLEYHSAMLAEMMSHLESSISVPVRVVKHLRVLLERRHGPEILQHARGIIGVTDEICRMELERTGANVPALTVPNGINVDSIPATGFKPFDGSHLHVGFVASLLNPWHGLDRVTRGLASYSGGVRITLHLIGEIPRDQVPDLSACNVETRFYSTLKGDDLNDVLARMNVAISSLALYRKSLHEACDLKSREYTARGLPFVIGYTDPDLQSIDDADQFALQVNNTDDAIDIEAVIAFAEAVGKQAGDLSESMRSSARSVMDWRVKAPQYIDFAKRLLS